MCILKYLRKFIHMHHVITLSPTNNHKHKKDKKVQLIFERCDCNLSFLYMESLIILQEGFAVTQVLT
jgi:hypothetical protein